MKKTAHKKINRETNKLQWYSTNQVFKKASRTKDFKEAYKTENLRIKLAQRIREVRLEKKLTQEAVAQRAAMPQSVVARLESGEHSVSLETLNRVASALGKKVEIV